MSTATVVVVNPVEALLSKIMSETTLGDKLVFYDQAQAELSEAELIKEETRKLNKDADLLRATIKSLREGPDGLIAIETRKAEYIKLEDDMVTEWLEDPKIKPWVELAKKQGENSGDFVLLAGQARAMAKESLKADREELFTKQELVLEALQTKMVELKALQKRVNAMAAEAGKRQYAAKDLFKKAGVAEKNPLFKK
jgi:hypothetical protein